MTTMLLAPLRFLADLSDVTQEATCTSNTWDCAHLLDVDTLPEGATTCAPYDGTYKNVEGNYGLLIFAALGMAIMAFGIGANDAANAWSTSVHSYAISLRKACIVAGLMETLGAATLGYGVSTSLQKGITDYKDKDCFACGRCDSRMTQYYVGMLSALYGAGTYLLICSWLKLPISTTHSIVGGVIGMTVAAVGFGCLDWGWEKLGGIVASWAISPIASGVISVLLYYLTWWVIFKASSPRKVAFITLPFLYFVVFFVIVFLCINKAPAAKDIEDYWAYVGGAIGGVAAGVFALCVILPLCHKNMPSVNPKSKLNQANLMAIHDEKTKSRKSAGTAFSPNAPDATSPGKSPMDLVTTAENVVSPTGRRPSEQVITEYEALDDEQEDAMWMFKYLLLLAATLDSYAHGSNDTANATAALSAVITGFKNGIYSCSSPDSTWWIMLIGGFFIALGIYLLGYKVMETLGKDITIFNYQRGFCVELASAITVVIASVLKLPVSSTHCQVGAVVGIGIAAFGWRNVQWSLVGKILLAWVFTVPIAGLFSGFLAWLIQFAF